MKIQKIRKVAKNWDARITRFKQGIIRDIQNREGNTLVFTQNKSARMIVVYGKLIAFER